MSIAIQNHTTAGYIRERLDKAVGNLEWPEKFPTYEVVNGDPRHSDHRPVMVALEGTHENREGQLIPNLKQSGYRRRGVPNQFKVLR